MARFAESGVAISLTPWGGVPDICAATSELNKAMLETFRARDISIPFPQYEVRMLGGNAGARLRSKAGLALESGALRKEGRA